jgi:hypothetical protein
MNNNQSHITDTCFHPVEISIPGAGAIVSFEQALPLLYDKVEGVLVIHPGGNHGSGTLELGVAGEEIFPENFHARVYMLMQSSHREDAMVNREFEKYMYEFRERAKGSTVSVKYTEPVNGESGLLYLVFKLTRGKTCG